MYFVIKGARIVSIRTSLPFGGVNSVIELSLEAGVGGASEQVICKREHRLQGLPSSHFSSQRLAHIGGITNLLPRLFARDAAIARVPMAPSTTWLIHEGCKDEIMTLKREIRRAIRERNSPKVGSQQSSSERAHYSIVTAHRQMKRVISQDTVGRVARVPEEDNLLAAQNASMAVRVVGANSHSLGCLVRVSVAASTRPQVPAQTSREVLLTVL